MSLTSFIRETRAEMKHVTWPKMSVTFTYTLIIIILCVVIAAFLGFFDYIFSILIQKIINAG